MQYKRYTQNLTLSNQVPTKTDYNFKGWSTYQNGPVVYLPGGTYSNNANVTLWAVWELAYIKPRITDFKAYRCNNNGDGDEAGQYVRVIFNWATDLQKTLVKILCSDSSLDKDVTSSQAGSNSGSVDEIIGNNNFSLETTYAVQIKVEDSKGSNTTAKISIPTAMFPIDIKKYGTGIAFGGVASEDNVMDVNFKARFNQGQKMWETDNTSNTQRWHYLGQVKIDRQGDYAHFKIFGGDGQNSELWQNMLMDIILKKGYQSEPSTTKYVGVTYTVHKMNHHKYNTDDVKVKVLCRTVGYAEVYVYFSWNYSTIRYIVDGVFNNFIRGNMTEMASLPTDGVEQPCIGGVIPILYNGDLTTIRSFRIPKNGDQGYGLCNSDGISIIRDFNNQNVTVDATGGELFLGFQNTNQINMFGGKYIFKKDSYLEMKNSSGVDTMIVMSRTDTNNTIRFGIGSRW